MRWEPEERKNERGKSIYTFNIELIMHDTNEASDEKCESCKKKTEGAAATEKEKEAEIRKMTEH